MLHLRAQEANREKKRSAGLQHKKMEKGLCLHISATKKQILRVSHYGKALKNSQFNKKIASNED